MSDYWWEQRVADAEFAEEQAQLREGMSHFRGAVEPHPIGSLTELQGRALKALMTGQSPEAWADQERRRMERAELEQMDRLHREWVSGDF